jgi:hypothetical protein
VCNLKKFFCLEKVFVNEETSERFLNVQTEAKKRKQKQRRTRTAWAVFKYCGTKTVPLRMKK